MPIFHDEGYKENDVDGEIQMSVEGSYQNTEQVTFKTAPAVRFASVVYQGNYEQLTSVHQSVARWVNDSGYTFNGAMFCIYHVSPAQTQNPDRSGYRGLLPAQRELRPHRSTPPVLKNRRFALLSAVFLASILAILRQRQVIVISKATIYFTVGHVNGKHEVKTLKRELDTFPGVISVSVNDEAESIAVDFDTTGVRQGQLQERIETLGYEIRAARSQNHIV